MKRLLLLTLALSLPLAQVVRADNDRDRKRHKREVEQQRNQQAARQAPVQSARRTVNRPVHPVARSVAPVNRQRGRYEPQFAGRNRSNSQVVATRENIGNRKVDRNRNNAPVAARENRGSHRDFNRNSFAVARGNVIRRPHNRDWWRRHYHTTFVLFGGGYYYWWNNYWYPAYGYDPYYNNYIYGEPIYGYNDLAPGQVLENVQLALRDQGYYPGAIDGVIGPQTRAALEAFQRDHGLIVTAAVDEPTLVTLGLT
jgi:hypothetical protein